jgi:hypothetical protein
MNEFIFATVLAASSLAANAQASALTRSLSTSEPVPPRDVLWRHHREWEPDQYRNQYASLPPPDGPERYTPAVRALALF